MTEMHNFSRDKQRAITEMLDMNKKALKSDAFSADKSAVKHKNPPQNSLAKSGLSMSEDEILIIGLILILAKDCRDTWLFLALAYILVG